MKNKFIVILIFAILMFNIVLAKNNASKINYVKTADEFLIFNSKVRKIIKYFLILPEEEIKIRTSNIDSLRIYSRLILEEDYKLSYKYLFIINSEEKKVEKSARVSDVSRGLEGEKISTFNKYVFKSDKDINNIVIKNISNQQLLIKIRDNTIRTKNIENEYIAISPQNSYDVRVLLINEKEYTYYIPKSSEIRLLLEGPVLLKIISRLVFDNPIVKKYNYRFELYDNGKLLTIFQEEAHKSAKAVFADYKDKIPSSGDVNIIKFSKGMHHIIIKDCDANRELIFRFYINKSAVGVIQE
ncbi:MAG: hypothetical protein U9R23_01055 [Candidatus Cloacimonadota bacterium]|nr:hypothetical protein [Candidatus Cloacimonadota bacterium]